MHPYLCLIIFISSHLEDHAASNVTQTLHPCLHAESNMFGMANFASAALFTAADAEQSHASTLFNGLRVRMGCATGELKSNVGFSALELAKGIFNRVVCNCSRPE